MPRTALAITMLALVALLPASAQATFAGGNGRLVIDGNAGIETLRSNGSDVIKLANAGYRASWSPDGTRIAFSKGNDGIWVMGQDGSNPVKLADGGVPVWSPDGSKIVFSRLEPPSEQSPYFNPVTLWVVDGDGGDPARVTEPDPQLVAQDFDPSWSPDGDRLAFTRQVSRQSTSAYEVWTVGADGTNLKRITSDKLNEYWPQWAPDGTRIAVQRSRFVVGSSGGPIAIWSFNSDGSDARQLTHPATFANDLFPRWSPDASRIAFDREGTDSGLYVINADGSGPMRLGDSGDGPVWSPDGTQIAITRQDWSGYPNVSTSLSVVGADGSDPHVVAQRTGFAGIEVDWQAIPFGPVAPSPAGVTFDHTPVTVVTGSRTVKLTNGGASSVSVDGVAITGAEAGNFQTSDDTCNGAALAPGEACHVGVRFAPASMGTHRAVLEFREGGGASAQRVALLGTGLSPVVPDPSAVDFGDTPYGTESDHTVTLTNVGAVDLAVGQLAVGGHDPERFSTFDDACSGAHLAPRAQCTVGVRFAPTRIAQRSATLVVNDDAVDSPQVVPLSGNGISPVALSPAQLGFGSAIWGAQSAPQTATLTNRGASDLSMGTVTVAGTGAASFVIVADSCSGATVAPGASCQTDVRFRPAGLGARAATLRFADDAADSPQSVPLSGTGISPVGLNPASIAFPSVPDHFTGARRTVTLTEPDRERGGGDWGRRGQFRAAGGYVHGPHPDDGANLRGGGPLPAPGRGRQDCEPPVLGQRDRQSAGGGAVGDGCARSVARAQCRGPQVRPRARRHDHPGEDGHPDQRRQPAPEHHCHRQGGRQPDRLPQPHRDLHRHGHTQPRPELHRQHRLPAHRDRRAHRHPHDHRHRAP
jgi:hypothetical protein